MTKSIVLAAALAALLPSLGYAQGVPGAHFLENWDLDADGAVTLAEAKERRSDIFFMFDADENEVLDAAEYVLFDETRAADMKENGHGMGNGGQKAQQGLQLDFNDTNSDGAVSKAEFLEHTADWITLMDRDADGVITVKDFGRQ